MTLATLRAQFAERIIKWQGQYGRSGLPWQNTRDPYRIWLSEIMLQQTQVETVIPYYLRFLERFPSVFVLADASIDEVLALWSGLGYYARARNLHRCAQQVALLGDFPSSAISLNELPGIGPSTSAAIAAFAYNECVTILDGNVQRILARIFGIEGVPTQSATAKRFWQLANELLPSVPTDMPAYTQGLMDFGAGYCTRHRPNCLNEGQQVLCPFKNECIAFSSGKVLSLPTPKNRKSLPIKTTYMLLAFNAHRQILLNKRPDKGIWGGLWSLPEYSTERTALCTTEKLTSDIYMQWLNALHLRLISNGEWVLGLKHTFSHYRLNMNVFQVNVESDSLVLGDYCWMAVDELSQYGLPQPVKKIITNFYECSH